MATQRERGKQISGLANSEFHTSSQSIQQIDALIAGKRSFKTTAGTVFIARPSFQHQREPRYQIEFT